MTGRRPCLIAFLLLVLWRVPALAGEPELTLGQARESTLSPGQAQSFVVSLQESDFARIRVNPRGQALVVKTCDPSGKPFRGAALGAQGGSLDLVAEARGTYRVEVAAANKTETATYTITLEKVVTLAARLASPRPVVESPRIRALRAAVESGDRESVRSFWEEVGKAGAPLIEPIDGDRENMAVTFLWRGLPETRNVLVLWLLWAVVAPDEFLMERLGQTDIWHKTVKVNRKMRMSYSLAPNAARIHPVSVGVDQDVIDMIAAAARTDPLNPKIWRDDPRSPDAPEFRARSVLEMPDAPPQPWIGRQPGVAEGRIERHPFRSAALKNEREIGVYLPPQYTPRADPYPLLVLFDEEAYLGETGQAPLVPTPTILDNLIAAGRIPPVVALFVGNAPGARDFELGCNPEFSRSLATELMPWAQGLYNLTEDPRRTVVAGSSRGGLAAACAGLWHPDTFGNVLSQSGAFHWIPPSSGDATAASSERNWVARQFIASSRKLPRFYLDAGSAEFDAIGDGNSILATTRALRDVLRAKGCEVHYQEFAGGHDYLGWRGTLADGLMALMGTTGPNATGERAPQR